MRGVRLRTICVVPDELPGHRDREPPASTEYFMPSANFSSEEQSKSRSASIRLDSAQEVPDRPVLLGMLIAVLAVSGFAIVSTSLAGNEDAAPDQAETSSADASEKSDVPGPPETQDKDTVIGPNGKPIQNPFPNRSPAPSLDGGEAWLNTSGEISLKDLRGKVVLIDFWTYCCINCIHVLPDLKYLEQKYPNELVVIGCHSAKFDNEKDTEAIRRAIVRYEIEHPVINDSNMIVWRKMGARSWPTLVLIDPEGNYCGYVSGEGNRELLDAVIARLIDWHKAKGTLDETPVQFDLERDRLESGALKFPGKILADEPGNRLFISDSNHNRIVVSTLDGKLVDVIGSGVIGAQDGSYSEASFDHPQGMALKGQTLYVADTENHMLRVVDLEAKKVSTLSGTGEQARFRSSGGPIESTALNSPWDLEIVDDTLFIAMAGPHQLWSHELGSDRIGVFAGTGREDILDGPHDESALAQPSGISSDGEFIYVADSEGSSIRKVSVSPDGKVTTIVGAHDLPSGRTLFEFGDRDGVGEEARLQHPLGVHYSDGKVFVADAYNHKIKVIDLKSNESTTWIGTGSMGTGLEPLQLHEPAGLALAGETLFVADTNNHRIVRINLKTKQASTFEVEGLAAPVRKAVSSTSSPAGSDKATVQKVEVQQVAPDKALKLAVTLRFPEEYKLNELAPLRAKVTSAETQELIAAGDLGRTIKGSAEGNVAAFEIPLAAEQGSATIELAVTYSYCRGGVGGLCKIHTSRWSIPVDVKVGGAKVIQLQTDMPR